MPQTNSNIYDVSISSEIISDEFEEKLANEIKESIDRELLKSLIREIELKEDGWYFERLEVPDEHYILFEDDHRLQFYFKNRKELIKYLKLKEVQ